MSYLVNQPIKPDRELELMHQPHHDSVERNGYTTGVTLMKVVHSTIM